MILELAYSQQPPHANDTPGLGNGIKESALQK